MMIDLRDDQLDVLDQALEYLIDRHGVRIDSVSATIDVFEKFAHKVARDRLIEIRECLKEQREDGE